MLTELSSHPSIEYTAFQDALGPLWNKRAGCALALLPVANGLGTSSVIKVRGTTGDLVKVYRLSYKGGVMNGVAAAMMKESFPRWAYRLMPGLAASARESGFIVVTEWIKRTRQQRQKRDRVFEQYCKNAVACIWQMLQSGFAQTRKLRFSKEDYILDSRFIHGRCIDSTYHNVRKRAQLQEPFTSDDLLPP